MDRAMAARRRGFCHGGIVRRLWFSLRLYRGDRRRGGVWGDRRRRRV